MFLEQLRVFTSHREWNLTRWAVLAAVALVDKVAALAHGELAQEASFLLQVIALRMLPIHSPPVQVPPIRWSDDVSPQLSMDDSQAAQLEEGPDAVCIHLFNASESEHRFCED